MNLKDWQDEEGKKSRELVAKSSAKLLDGKRIGFVEDLVPEFKDLKNKSYGRFSVPYNIKNAEEQPSKNLSVLLGSGFYDCLIVPLYPYPDKTTFEIRYGLSKNRGSKVTFEQFVDMIREGRLKIYLAAPPTTYEAKYLEAVLRACERSPSGQLPPLVGYRISDLMFRWKLISVCLAEDIEPSKKMFLEVLKLHPEYSFGKCREEARQIFGEEFLNSYAKRHYLTMERAINIGATQLSDLRYFGFEGLVDVALRSTSIHANVGWRLLQAYHDYLVKPLYGLQGFTNHGWIAVENMLFLRMVPEQLGVIWEDILSSSPSSSSVMSPEITLNAVELTWKELAEFLDAHPEEELKKTVVETNRCLSEFDPLSAMRHFRRIDEIIREKYNKEIQELQRKTKVFQVGINLGKHFTYATGKLSLLLASLMASQGHFEWVARYIATSTGLEWASKQLEKLSPEDIVKWLAKKWPFKDPGLPFILWQHRIGEISEKKQK